MADILIMLLCLQGERLIFYYFLNCKDSYEGGSLRIEV